MKLQREQGHTTGPTDGAAQRRSARPLPGDVSATVSGEESHPSAPEGWPLGYGCQNTWDTPPPRSFKSLEPLSRFVKGLLHTLNENLPSRVSVRRCPPVSRVTRVAVRLAAGHRMSRGASLSEAKETLFLVCFAHNRVYGALPTELSSSQEPPLCHQPSGRGTWGWPPCSEGCVAL